MNIFKKIWSKLKSKSSAGAGGAETKTVVKVSEQEIRDVVYSIMSDTNKWDNYNNLWGEVPSIKYWENVVLAICFAESSFNKYESYFEKTMGYYSLGLMQLSYEDCRAYKYPLDKSKDEIFEVRKNIELGLIILNRLVGRYGHYIFNDGNYWAVLQPKNKRHKVFLDKFNEYQGRG